MSDLLINAQRVTTQAGKIKGYNDKIKEQFSSVETAVGKLDDKWNSPSASTAMDKFSTIKNTYNDARYQVIDDYVAFLNQQVGVGYTQTESLNKTLAAQFK